MKHLSTILTLLAATPLVAQGSVISASTATDFGVVAVDATGTQLDSIAQNTPIGRGLAIRAAVGGGSTGRDGAFAGTAVSPSPAGGPGLPGAGITIRETGRAVAVSAGAVLSAGTSADAPRAPSPVRGAHGVTLSFALPAGANGQVLVHWAARATSHASLTASIDVDGDGTADWTGTAAAPDRRAIPVTAGANGIAIAITTDGGVSLSGAGQEGYDGLLEVSLVRAVGTFTCTWTGFGPSCVGSLVGSDAPSPRGIQLTLGVAGATPSSSGVLVFGSQAANPSPLPGGVCNLLIDRGARNVFVGGFHTDANGDATMVIQVPARALTIDMQALTMDRTNRIIGSTNGLNLVCQ